MVRLQELVQLYRRLKSQDLVIFSDEVASARRRFQFHTGPSGIDETLKNVSSSEGICWRHRSSDRRQAELSLAQLKEGLIVVENEFLKLRLEAKSSMTQSQYWTLMEKIGEKSKQVRSEESKRLQKKEMNLKNRSENCKRHVSG